MVASSWLSPCTVGMSCACDELISFSLQQLATQPPEFGMRGTTLSAAATSLARCFGTCTRAEELSRVWTAADTIRTQLGGFEYRVRKPRPHLFSRDPLLEIVEVLEPDVHAGVVDLAIQTGLT